MGNGLSIILLSATVDGDAVVDGVVVNQWISNSFDVEKIRHNTITFRARMSPSLHSIHKFFYEICLLINQLADHTFRIY